MFGMTGVSTHPQETVFQTATFKVVVEFTLDIRWQYPAPLCQMGSERRVVLFFDDPIEQGLLGPVALVTTSILVPGGRSRVAVLAAA